MKHTGGSTITLRTCADTISESDDEESCLLAENRGMRERRRRLHTQAEQRRRNAIKRGFEGLLELVHPLKGPLHCHTLRMSKSTILYKAISVIERLGKQNNARLIELQNLEKEVEALRIINSNYEELSFLKACGRKESVQPVSDDTKLKVFESFANSLFESFDECVKLECFPGLCRFIISWMEDNCRIENLSAVMDLVLNHTFRTSSAAVDANSSESFLLNSRPASSYSDCHHPMNSYPHTDVRIHQHVGILSSDSSTSKLQAYDCGAPQPGASTNSSYHLQFALPLLPHATSQFSFKTNVVDPDKKLNADSVNPHADSVFITERSLCPRSLTKQNQPVDSLSPNSYLQNVLSSTQLHTNKRPLPAKLSLHDGRYKPL